MTDARQQHHEDHDGCKNDDKPNVIYIYDHVKDAGTKTFPPKPQYVRGGYIFICPICSKEINSHNYTRLAPFWEQACENHLMDKHGGEYLDRCRITIYP